MSVALVDISTRQVHFIPARKSGKLTVKEFFANVEDELQRTTTESGSCTRVLRAAVGDRCVNICDRKRTIQYYLLDGKPWYMKTAVFPPKLTALCIKDASSVVGGNDDDDCATEATVRVDLEKCSVRELKFMFSRMTCTPTSGLHLFWGQSELQDDKNLSFYDLTDGSNLAYICSPAKSRIGFDVPYINIGQQSSSEQQNKKGMSVVNGRVNGDLCPVWRRATPGLWLEGKCTNEICVAYSKMVIVNQGFCDLDFISECQDCNCPMCYEPLVPVLCGFNRCKWATVGWRRQAGLAEGELDTTVRTEWQRLEKDYQCIVPERDNWLIFKVTTQPLEGFKLCKQCLCKALPQQTGSGVTVSTTTTADCGHTSHASCRKEADVSCLECVGNQNITAYQKLFC